MSASSNPRNHIGCGTLPYLLAAVLAVATGCAAEAPGDAVELRLADATSSPTIFGGEKDEGGDGLEGVVALRVGTGTTFELCSGALVAPNVVLTARHCVTRTSTTSVSCDDKGGSANGTHVIGDEEPSTIGVYLGVSPSFAKAPVARARAIVAPTGPYLCDSDIALVVLETSITTVTPLALRLHRPARTGESIRAVGYGQNDQGSPIGTRFRRGGVAVLAQGAGVSPSKTPLGPHEFEVGTSICQGDSGGPAISEESGAVIGVVSRGGGCTEEFGHIYTTTAGFDEVFADAFRQAGATLIAESSDEVTGGASTRSKSTSSPTSLPGETPTAAPGCSLTPASHTASGAHLAAAAAVMVMFAFRRRRPR